MKISFFAVSGFLLALPCARPAFSQTVVKTLTPVGAGTTLEREIKAPFMVASIAFSPDGKTLASTGFGSDVSLLDAETGRQLRILRSEGDMNVVRFSPDGKWVVCAMGATSVNSKIIIWNAQSGEKWKEILSPGRSLTDLCFSPDGRSIAASSGHAVGFADAAETDKTLFGEVRVWDMESGELKTNTSWDDHQVWSVAFSPDGKSVAGASNDEIRLWDAMTGELKQRLSAPGALMRSMTFLASGNLVGSSQNYSEPEVWDLTTGKLARHFIGNIKGAWGAALSPDEKLLVTATPNFPVGLWDMAKGVLIWSSPVAARATLTVAFSPDGTRFASAGEDGIIKLWRVR